MTRIQRLGAATLLLVVTLTGCGTPGNAVNTGNAGGFVGNRVGGMIENGIGQDGHGGAAHTGMAGTSGLAGAAHTGTAGAAAGATLTTPTSPRTRGPLGDWTDEVRTQSVAVDSTRRTVDIQIGSGPATASSTHLSNRHPTNGGLRGNAKSIVVPLGWTVNVITDNTSTRALSIVPFPADGDAHAMGAGSSVEGIGQGHRGVGPGAATGVGAGAAAGMVAAPAPRRVLTKPSRRPGTSFVATTPGDYAILQLNRGRPNQVIDIVTVTASAQPPAIATSTR